MIVVCSILPVAKLAAASLIGQRLLARKETPAAFPAYCTLCFEPSPRTVFHPEIQHEKQYNNVISRNCMATNSELNCFIYLAKLFESFFFWWVCCLKKHMTVESQTIFLKIRFIKNMSRLALSSIKNRGEGSWALCTSFLIPDTLWLHTPNAYNNLFSPPPIKNPTSASGQSHPIMGSKGLALPPTNVARVQIPASTPYVNEFVVGSLVCSESFLSGCWGFSPLLKN